MHYTERTYAIGGKIYTILMSGGAYKASVQFHEKISYTLAGLASIKNRSGQCRRDLILALFCYHISHSCNKRKTSCI